MITIISFENYTSHRREELMEKHGSEEISVDCKDCEDGWTTCHECDHSRECPECDGSGQVSIFPSEFVPERRDYYRQVFSDVIKYCQVMPGDFLDNISKAISDLNRQFPITNWRSII